MDEKEPMSPPVQMEFLKKLMGAIRELSLPKNPPSPEKAVDWTISQLAKQIKHILFFAVFSCIVVCISILMFLIGMPARKIVHEHGKLLFLRRFRLEAQVKRFN